MGEGETKSCKGWTRLPPDRVTTTTIAIAVESEAIERAPRNIQDETSANREKILVPRKKTEDVPDEIKIRSAVEMTPWERGTALGLLSFGAAPMVITWIRLFTLSPFDPKTWVQLSVLGLFTFVSIETISLILLKGFRRIELSDSTMRWLGGAALLEVGPMAYYIVKHL
jgi:hypothetical protein